MKISVLTLGCKVNKYESDALIGKLNSLGYQTTDKLEPADVFVINTCAVTGEAEKKSRQMIARCRKFNNNAKIFVCGCASQHSAEQFLDRNVEVVIGASGKLKLVEYIKNLSENKQKNIIDLEELPLIYQDDMQALQTRTRAYLKIQDGCDNFCSYCIIPYLRGRSRSRSFEAIVNEAKMLGEEIKEIVLTGINVTDYKIDGESGLLPLLQELDKLDKRLRLSSIEDGLISEEFVSGLAKLKNFCSHFHLSLQSGSDSILKRMNRHYTSRQFADSVSLIRKYFVNPAITTDIIVGFPDESEEEFEQSYNFAKEIKFSQLHIFKYSSREGTVASKIYKDLDFNVKKSRLERLEKLGKELKKEFISHNKEGEVLVEEKEGEYFVGYTKNYIKCYISSKENLIDKIVKVKIGAPYMEGAKAEKI